VTTSDYGESGRLVTTIKSAKVVKGLQVELGYLVFRLCGES